MTDKYRWSDPAMSATTRAPDDPNGQMSTDAAGNKPPKDGLAEMPRPGAKKSTPEVRLYDDRPGDE